MDVIRKIGRVPVDPNSKPKLPVVINECGEVGD